jgi:hypothetical protein
VPEDKVRQRRGGEGGGDVGACHLSPPSLPSSVAPLQIDELITPELFSTKFTWQYELWFEVKEKKRALEEAMR